MERERERERNGGAVPGVRGQKPERKRKRKMLPNHLSLSLSCGTFPRHSVTATPGNRDATLFGSLQNAKVRPTRSTHSTHSTPSEQRDKKKLQKKKSYRCKPGPGFAPEVRCPGDRLPPQVPREAPRQERGRRGRAHATRPPNPCALPIHAPHGLNRGPRRGRRGQRRRAGGKK